MVTFHLTSSSGPGDPSLFFLFSLILAGVMILILTRLILVPKYGWGIFWVIVSVVGCTFIGSLVATWDTDLSVFNSISVATGTLTLGYPFNLLRPTTLSFDRIASVEIGMAPNWNNDPNVQTLEISLRDGSAVGSTRDVSALESEAMQSALESIAYPHCVTTTEQDEDTELFVGHRAIWRERFGTGNFASTPGQSPGPTHSCL
jgi:hypothetical protein